MKWYFATRTKNAGLVKKISEVLESRGHEVSFDWTKYGKIRLSDEPACRDVAEKISRAIMESDVFVLISDSSGTDMYTEKGIAIANAYHMSKPRIYAVGEHNKRSVMHLHPSIKHMSLREVFAKECPEIRFSEFEIDYDILK